MKQQRPPGKVRIISGKWRGRKLPVAAGDDLRPTPDRARETLFNWLDPMVDGADCLDLFAGTGALGFEALSRGANKVLMVEKNPALVQQLKQQSQQLMVADELQIINVDALQWLRTSSSKFDIVFLDPPFNENLLAGACELLVNKGHLQLGALIYVETGSEFNIDQNNFQLVNQSHAGQVQYMLLKFDQGDGN